MNLKISRVFRGAFQFYIKTQQQYFNVFMSLNIYKQIFMFSFHQNTNLKLYEIAEWHLFFLFQKCYNVIMFIVTVAE